ncbi:MAG: tetratricopeptide repeat protein [Pirellulales bacterium]
MPVVQTQRMRIAVIFGMGMAAWVGGWAIAPTAQAFHGHRVVVRQPAGISYWGSAYATRGPGRYVYRPYVYRPAVGYYSAYRPHYYAPRVYRAPVYSYRSYAYRPYTYGAYPYGVYCPPYSTYRSSIYYSYPIDVAPWGWFGANDRANPAIGAEGVGIEGLMDVAPAAPLARQPVGVRDVQLANGALNPLADRAPGRVVAAARPLVQQLLGGREGEIPGLVRQVVNQVATNGPRPAGVGRVADRSMSLNATPSTEEGRRRAANYVQQGDELFARGRYLEANSVYQKAAGVAADSAEPWFRQGFSYLAAGRYERAAQAIQRGIALEPEYAHSGFRLSRLYAGDSSAFDKHLETLAQAALDAPNNPDLVYLVGVALHCDGEPERAAPFFAKVAELSGADASHIAAFQAPGFERDRAPEGRPAARTAVR